MPLEVVIVALLLPEKFTSGLIIVTDFIHSFRLVHSAVDNSVDD